MRQVVQQFPDQPEDVETWVTTKSNRLRRAGFKVPLDLITAEVRFAMRSPARLPHRTRVAPCNGWCTMPSVELIFPVHFFGLQDTDDLRELDFTAFEAGFILEQVDSLE